MANRRTSSRSFGLEPTRYKPTAAISPSTQTRVIGSPIHLDGRASSVSDGSALTYAWTILSKPLGSAVDGLRSTEDDDSVVTFTPDVTGPYEVGLVVSTAYRSSDQVSASVSVQAVLVSSLIRETPDASFMFRVLSDFWSRIEDRAMLPVLWSAYTQVAACDLLRLFQVDYAKSIADIQSLFQRRWLAYEPKLPLEPAQHTGVYGHHQSGTTAFTGSATSTATGVVVSEREVILLAGAPTVDAIGTDLRVYTGANASETAYLISRLNSDGSGYLVSVTTPFPAPSGDILVTGSDLILLRLDDEVTSASLDFAVDTDAAVGDVLRIESGADRGYYTITAVGVGLTLDRAVSSNRSGVTFTLFKAVRVTAQRTVSPLTDTVYIPQDDADLDEFATSEISGTGTITGPYEILVSSRHVFDAMAGRSIRVTSGADSGRTFTVAAVNSSGTGYIIGSSFSGPFPETEVSYAVEVVADISNRVLVLEDRAYRILSATLDENQPSTDDGGRGPLWVVTLAEAAAPAGMESLSWRIAATLISDQYNADADFDLEELGVMAGDLLVVEAVRSDNGKVAEIPCVVLGVAGNYVAFDVGSTAPAVGENGALLDEEIQQIADEWALPRVYEDTDGSTVIDLLAEAVRQILVSGAFAAANWNLPVDSTTDVDLTYFTVRLRARRIIRNSRIRVDDDLASVPALFEYIVKPDVGEDEDGNIVLVAKDGTEVALDRSPLELVENRDFTVSAEATLTGETAQTTAESGTITLPNGDLIDRDVRPGDVVTLETGADQGDYVILSVTSATTLRVMTEDGAIPAHASTGLRYTITRRVSGNFLRFVDGLFTAESPAPERLWAETSFFDNYRYIEANFGVMVGLTKEQLDEYGSSQISYKGAVSGLMFAWARGPTLENVSIGAHILLGLPVTEAAGVITDIDPEYATGRGRILIEDIDQDGNGTGLVRIYYYRPESESVLDDFEGLATNLDTGEAFAVGDQVPAFAALSKSVVVTDYVEDPNWWRVGGITAGTGQELQKFHTWQVLVDVGAVDSRDIPLVAQFAGAIRPIYTKPNIVLVLFLDDEISTEDDLSFEGTLYEYDDIAFSLQSTRMQDDYSGSEALRLLDYPSLSSRTLFHGYDLVTTAGSGVVTSARGGFSSVPTGAPNAWFPDHQMVNPDHADTTLAGAALPQNLVRASDILFITTGPNRGRYQVSAVGADTALTVIRALDALGQELPPRSRVIATMEAATGQEFYVQRFDVNPIVQGSGDAVATSPIFTVATANFIWNGVAVGDRLIITAGADMGRHPIVAVTRTTLALASALTATGTVPFVVEREVLRTNPILGGSDADLHATDPLLEIPSGGVRVAGIRKDDVLHIASGPYSGREYRIIGTVGDTEVWLDDGVSFPAAAGLLADYYIYRPHLSPTPSGTDLRLEDIGLYDAVEQVVYRPQTVFLSVSDVTIADSVLTSAMTDLQAGGVTAAMTLEIMKPGAIYDVIADAGVYDIDAVSGFTVTVGVVLRDAAAPVQVDFYADANFAVADDVVTCPHDVEALGVVPGDIFSFSAGEFTVRAVSTTTVTLTQGTGLTANYTGRILRRTLS